MKNLTVFVVLFSLLVLSACAPKPTAERVVQDAIEKMGGAEKLTAIQDQVSHWDFTMYILPPGMPGSEMSMMESSESDEDMKMEDDIMMEQNEAMGDAEEMPELEMAGHKMPMTITYKRPNKLRMDTMNEVGEVVSSMVYDGTKGWMSEMGEQIPMNEAQTQEHATMAKTWIDFLADHKEKGITLTLLEDDMLDGQNYHVLQMTDEFGNISDLYINTKTNLVEKQSGDMTNYMGEKEPTFMLYKDYQLRDGILFSHHIEFYQEDGTLVWEAKLKELSHNTGVSDEFFTSEEMTMK